MDTDAILRLMQQVAEQVINPRFRALAQGEVMEKNPGDLVTVADREAEALITQALQQAYPDAVILGEEAVALRPELLQEYRSAAHAFTVDPVDGTKNFVHGSPDHAVMVGEVIDGHATRGWIWHPQYRTGFLVTAGRGAWRENPDGTRDALVRPPAPEPAHARAVTSRRSMLGKHLGAFPALDLTWVCCGVDYPQLVAGAADVILYGSPSPWDHVPGTLLVTEAGGAVATRAGQPYQVQGEPVSGLVIAANEELLAAMLHQLEPLETSNH